MWESSMKSLARQKHVEKSETFKISKEVLKVHFSIHFYLVYHSL